jgi:MFS family permease
MSEPGKKRLSPTVIALGTVSFFTDFSSEMIYPLLPVFLSVVLGAGAIALGVIEGIAESTAAFLKLFSGIWTDRVKRRKPFVLAGYGVAGVARPFIGLAKVWPFVLAMRFFDRVGKGIRTSPRDALIADVTDPDMRGAAFGFHRAMDHGGAVFGPLVASALLVIAGLSMREVFLLAAIHAAVVIVVIVVWVREPARHEHTVVCRESIRQSWGKLGPDFRMLLLALLVFTLGNSTDMFLLLRLSGAGVSPAGLATLWALFHVVKMVSNYFGGRLSDRTGRRILITAGWLFYAAVYVAFAFIDSWTGLVAVFMSYGLYFGLTEPSEKAWVADLVTPDLRGTAFGCYNCVIGIAALPASLLFGLLWYLGGSALAFCTGAGLALAAAVVLFFVRSGKGPAPVTQAS